MSYVKVFCLDKSELVEFETHSGGYRSDIYVMIENNFFHVYIYDIRRLKEDFETEIKEYGFFTTDNNIIIVKEVTLKCIKYTIEKLFEQKYFDNLKPLIQILVPEQLFEVGC